MEKVRYSLGAIIIVSMLLLIFANYGKAYSVSPEVEKLQAIVEHYESRKIVCATLYMQWLDAFWVADERKIVNYAVRQGCWVGVN